MNITVDTVLQRDVEHISTPLNGEFVAMSIERGEYFGIGGVGARAWEMLTEACSVAQLCQQICGEYEVERAICEADLIRFAEEMLELGLLSTPDI